MEAVTEGRIVGDIDSRGKPRVQTVNDGESMTVQSDAHLADIQNIMAQYAETGMESLDEADLVYKDVSEFTDLQDAFAQAALAEIEFMKLPSKVREVFEHDVAVWLDTAHDEDKRDALVERGYLRAEKVPPKEEPKTEPKVASESGIKATEGDALEKPAE